MRFHQIFPLTILMISYFFINDQQIKFLLTNRLEFIHNNLRDSDLIPKFFSILYQHSNFLMGTNLKLTTITLYNSPQIYLGNTAPLSSFFSKNLQEKIIAQEKQVYFQVKYNYSNNLKYKIPAFCQLNHNQFLYCFPKNLDACQGKLIIQSAELTEQNNQIIINYNVSCNHLDMKKDKNWQQKNTKYESALTNGNIDLWFLLDKLQLFFVQLQEQNSYKKLYQKKEPQEIKGNLENSQKQKEFKLNKDQQINKHYLKPTKSIYQGKISLIKNSQKSNQYESFQGQELNKSNINIQKPNLYQQLDMKNINKNSSADQEQQIYSYQLQSKEKNSPEQNQNKPPKQIIIETPKFGTRLSVNQAQAKNPSKQNLQVIQLNQQEKTEKLNQKISGEPEFQIVDQETIDTMSSSQTQKQEKNQIYMSFGVQSTQENSKENSFSEASQQFQEKQERKIISKEINEQKVTEKIVGIENMEKNRENKEKNETMKNIKIKFYKQNI